MGLKLPHLAKLLLGSWLGIWFIIPPYLRLRGFCLFADFGPDLFEGLQVELASICFRRLCCGHIVTSYYTPRHP